MSTARPGVSRRERLASARLYLVLPSAPADADADAHEAMLEALTRAAVAGGVEIVQLREKERREQDLIELAARLARVCAQLGALFIVNDSPALALQASADGVHVGQDDMSVRRVRAIVGGELLVGLSTHAPQEIDAVRARDGAGSPLVDYIAVGPVHATPTKPGRRAVGSELVGYASAHAPVPFFAIGGLDASNLHEVLDAGATRAVILRAIAQADDPRAAARELRAQLERAPGDGKG
jgi:thiamine-phosphate pyrophosphorylase